MVQWCHFILRLIEDFGFLYAELQRDMPEHAPDKIYNLFLQSNGISTDTRSVEPGQIFLALKGPNFDANAFAREALEKGASYAIVDDDTLEDERAIVVPDGLQTLQQLATLHRSHMEIPVVGLTGSNGKTTTKELMQAVLATKYRSYATPGNLNNHIGVPQTILRCPSDAEIMIVEMGANHIGEIASLCQIAQPTCGLITNVGKDHLEGFGSPEGSLRANSELFQYLLETEGVAFINSEDPVLANMAKRFDDPVFYPGKDDFLHVSLEAASPFVEYAHENGDKVRSQLAGGFNFYNIAAALCVGKHFEVDPQAADQAIESYTPANNRSQWVETEHNNVFLDAYNANPSSMEVALESLAAVHEVPKAVILGDMFELGEYEEEEHKALGQKIAALNFDAVLLCGQAMEHAAKEVPSALHFLTTQDCVAHLRETPLKDHVVLVKGSRGMALEACMKYL